MSQSRLLHLASGWVKVSGDECARLSVEVVFHETEPKGSPTRYRLSFRGFVPRLRGESFADQAEAERAFAEAADVHGLEVRW